ncbi:Tfp pilus assembly protein PilV [Bacillus thermophilus]|jgi:Tfp pilus assembly protein PilV|uniref:Tfp pilus assembly protein PilV n=1 Tax=Siminovitchia thermophila TaxID=1245522 RepID=A0ABS2R8K7_9BACI|nr:DUF4129 domain-containing protein [Siminovitchia thermophila]MBM7715977.1 Tfp pilus assembly protein PilV [Siminovitchia thermophila]ONK21614.1 hypothetical protein BLX87_20540 [Bacillus sp. VT-16-64]
MLEADEAGKKLKEILGKDEYQAYQSDPLSEWWGKIKEQFANWLEGLFPSWEAPQSASGPLFIAVVVMFVIVLGITAFFVARTVSRSRRFRDDQPFQSKKYLEWTCLKHLSEAKKLENIGELSPAVRHLFLALLLYSDEQGWLKAKIWKTNWEYYEEIKHTNISWAERFYELAKVFDEIAYGEKQISPEEFSRFRNKVMAWLEQVEEKMGS